MAIESGAGVKRENMVSWDMVGRKDDMSVKVEDIVNNFFHLPLANTR